MLVFDQTAQFAIGFVIVVTKVAQHVAFLEIDDFENIFGIFNVIYF
jgi:hypothetical protein